MSEQAPRKLIICCDGTGNEIKGDQSNLLKFFHMLKHDEEQICFYDVGVGTISSSSDWNGLWNRSKSFIDLLIGSGIDKNVINAYQFIVQNYQKGDQIFLFGFSRGAYAVRVLAAFIHMVGVLNPKQQHLISYAYRAYKTVSINNDNEIAYRVNRMLRTQRPSINMIGCWDTVGSVIVPNAKYGFLPKFQDLPFVNENPSVKKFRHALAANECRRMYHPIMWKEPQQYRRVVYRTDDQTMPQDIKQLWFSGVHSDIGGGYPESQSQLSKIPLIWMLEEAQKSDLVFRKRMVNMMAYGKDNYTGHEKRGYVAPDANAKPNRSMHFIWKICEFLPARAKGNFGRNRRKLLGFYLPQFESRHLGDAPEFYDSGEPSSSF